MDYSITAKELLEKLGGEKNIQSLTHCMTRLRFVLKDDSKIDDDVVGKIPGVIGVNRQGGQYQVIIGNNVAKCFREINKIANFSEASAESAPKEKQNPVGMVIDFISGCMTPLFTAIIAGGLIKVLLIIFGPTLLGVMETTGDTYIILNALGDAPFYFLPVLVAYTASRKLNCNSFLAVTVAAMLIYPDLITLLGSDTPTYLFGVIPVTHASYSSSIIPAMLAVVLLKYVEIGVDKITPDWAKNFLKPLLIVLITGLVTLVVLAPLGSIIGEGLQVVINAIYGFAPWFALLIFAAFMPFIVMTGMHWAFTPAAVMALANPGYEMLLIPAVLCSNTAQAGAAFGVAFKTRDRDMKKMAIPAGISALLAGVTEPAMYGVTLKLKKPMIAACIAGGIGGLIAGIVHLKAYAFATPCLTAIVQFIAPDGGRNIIFAVIIFAVSFILSFVLAFIMTDKGGNVQAAEGSADGNVQTTGKLQDGQHDNAATAAGNGEKNSAAAGKPLTVYNPLKGEVIPLADVDDAAFSSEVLGKGYAVKPSVGMVKAPFSGTVETLMDSYHALGLISDDGMVLLIHVGLDTVQLNGKHFTPKVKVGDRVSIGDVLLEFDKEAIEAEGYQTVTPVILTNVDDYSKMEIGEPGVKDFGEEMISLEK